MSDHLDEGEHESDLPERALGLVEAGEAAGVRLRVMGGVAVALHSPSARHRSLRRDYADLDFVSDTTGRRLDDLLIAHGWEPDKRFNSIHGRSRRLYHDGDGRQVDVFVGIFEMCHKLPLAERLGADSPTIPLAELFLTKAQIVELNEKDVLDLCALLADHDVGAGDEETIDAGRIAALCSRDWGLWRTVTGTLDKLEHGLGPVGQLEESVAQPVRRGIAAARAAIDEAPKSVRWKTRARVGERVPWYALPEDPRRGVSAATQQPVA
jgi:hypothetical protein